ncbi:MAG: glycosyltransferase family 4 protein [Chitinophagaceae bacterium]|nr:glycosyltransferase family 4 protein [Chitinophagaceae bacterium]
MKKFVMDNIRIAYITPEAPPFSGGGIATFINNITKGMKKADVYCEVFAPSDTGHTGTAMLNGVPVHRIAVPESSSFKNEIVPFFLSRHEEVHFTIVESCEIHASLFELIKNKRPELKYVIRVQMPVVLQMKLNLTYQSIPSKLRYVLGAFRRFRWDLGFWNRMDVKRESNPEYLVCEQADAIIAPSYSFKEWLTNFWKLPEEKISVIPHLFDFSTMEQVMGKVSERDNHITRILFTGKLNVHKGVINLAKAANLLLKKYPNVEFILVGEDWPSVYGNRTVKTSELIRYITNNHPAVKLAGKIPYNEMAQYYAEGDICIFPSLWEAWGYTCTEAMSMGKAVIGSKYGGMADAIKHGENGLLIDPYDYMDIAEKIEQLINNKILRDKLGSAARETIHNELSFERLVRKNIDFYEKDLPKGRPPRRA